MSHTHMPAQQIIGFINNKAALQVKFNQAWLRSAIDKSTTLVLCCELQPTGLKVLETAIIEQDFTGDDNIINVQTDTDALEGYLTTLPIMGAVMSQNLTLLQRGDATRPSIYRFGATEKLVICDNGHAHLCDAQSDAYIRGIGWQGVENMGYDPKKLLRGEREDQFINKECAHD